jgi:hypothetical protein
VACCISSAAKAIDDDLMGEKLKSKAYALSTLYENSDLF